MLLGSKNRPRSRLSEAMFRFSKGPSRFLRRAPRTGCSPEQEVYHESGEYLGCIEYLLDFTALKELAEAKKDSHRFVSDQREASKSEEAR